MCSIVCARVYIVAHMHVHLSSHTPRNPVMFFFSKSRESTKKETVSIYARLDASKNVR